MWNSSAVSFEKKNFTLNMSIIMRSSDLFSKQTQLHLASWSYFFYPKKKKDSFVCAFLHYID